MSRLYDIYKDEIVPAMTKKFGYIHAKNLPGPNGKCNVRGYNNVAFVNKP